MARNTNCRLKRPDPATILGTATCGMEMHSREPFLLLVPAKSSRTRCLRQDCRASECIGTAVALYPVLKRQNEGLALGFVGSRVLEGAGILAGVACLLSIVSLRQAAAGTGALATGQTLAILYDRIFLLSQSLMPAVNDLLLGLLLYQSRLVPRVLPLIAFIGAPLLLASDIAVLFSLWERTSTATALAALPVAVFEFSLGVYLLVKGFKPSPILSSDTRDAGVNRSFGPVAADR
jgi:hypothetical protein